MDFELPQFIQCSISYSIGIQILKHLNILFVVVVVVVKAYY